MNGVNPRETSACLLGPEPVRRVWSGMLGNTLNHLDQGKVDFTLHRWKRGATMVISFGGKEKSGNAAVT